MKDKNRFQVWYFCVRATKVITELIRLQSGFAWPDDVTPVLGIDPLSLVGSGPTQLVTY